MAFVEWDLEQVPYPLPDGAFDGVVFTEVFEHLRDYPVGRCRSAHEFSGRADISSSHHPQCRLRDEQTSAAARAIRLHAHAGLDREGSRSARHAREYLFSEVEQAMSIAGLDVVTNT